MSILTSFLALCALTGCDSIGQYSLIIQHAKVWTGDPARPFADSIGIDYQGRFAFVGNGLLARPGKETTSLTGVIDAHGARIIPGLIDSHLHLISGGLQLSRLQLREVADRAAFIDAIAEHVRQTPTGQWIQGGRWSTESWPDPAQPTKAWIDPVTPDHPVLLYRMDGHGALANSVALRFAGIDRNGPPDPPGGRIERDPATNEPTGILKDTAIGLVVGRRNMRAADDVDPADVARLVSEPSAKELDDALAAAMKEANRHGLTCVHTMSPWSDIAVLDRARAAGKLSLRVRVYVMEDDWRDYISRAKSHRGDDWVAIRGFKQFADGSMGSRTAYMSAAYADRDPQDRDCCGLPREILRIKNPGAPKSEPNRNSLLDQLCGAAAESGLTPAIHAIGDQANREVLDTYGGHFGNQFGPPSTRGTPAPEQRAFYCPELPTSMRLRIEHAQHLSSADISRFARLGVVASMQPYHKADDGRYAEKAIGPDRCKTSYAFRSLLDSGAHVAFGSDWPVVSLNPFLGIHAAVTGRTLDGKVFVPEQNITVEETLRCYTTGAAYAAGDEARLGMIKPGHLADFVILKSDILGFDGLKSEILKSEIPSIDRTQVAATYVGGRMVWHE